MIDRFGPIARNSFLNLVGFTIPLLAGLVSVPVITRELGPARFGLLSLAFAILEYSTLFDLGLGAATTREVSASLARSDENVSTLISGSIVSQMLLGSVGALILMTIAPLLVDHVFVIPPGIRNEAVSVFRILALMTPPTLLLLSLRGVLEAAQRFDLSNAVRVPSSVMTFVIPAVAASAGYSLPAIVAMLLIARVSIVAVMVFVVMRTIPSLKWQLKLDWPALKPLFLFGGWMSVSNVVSPLLVYLDRFMLGSLIGLTAVGYYTAPFDGVMRLLILPASLMGAVFPSVSAMSAIGDHTSVKRIFGKAFAKTLMISSGPALILAFAGPLLLRLWLGPVFAEQGATAIRILAVGVFINALAHVPSGVITAMGRPDVVARFHIFELFIHVPAAWLLITHYGVAGAAAAWTFRVTVDAALLFFTALRMLKDFPNTIPPDIRDPVPILP
ncbi:MAG TPA: flippase [Gemmatimonadaceae bacterium]|nr:flippase [Gemmatimonadaceae bacterium]